MPRRWIMKRRIRRRTRRAREALSFQHAWPEVPLLMDLPHLLGDGRISSRYLDNCYGSLRCTLLWLLSLCSKLINENYLPGQIGTVKALEYNSRQQTHK